MTDKEKIELKLKEAFDKGFVPKELQYSMKERGHVGQVYLVPDQPDSIKSIPDGKDENGNPKYREYLVGRIGIGYSIEEANPETGETQSTRHIVIYDTEEIEAIMQEIG